MSKKPPPVSIFVSSTWDDLTTERRAVIEALNSLRSMKFVGMEYSGACSKPPLDSSLKEARECDAYVGIFAGRYGSGITAEEYRAADAEGKPCFIFFKDSLSGPLEVDSEPERREQLQILKAELLARHVCKKFTVPKDLANQVMASLSNWYEHEFFPRWLAEQWDGPHQLKIPPADFVGRKDDIKKLKEALKPSETAKIVGLSGMGGVGKTALAFVVAKQLCADYPQAQLLIELHSMRNTSLDLALALRRCVVALGGEIHPTDDIDELSKTYRSILSGKRCLVVLDDAANESQVRAFIPPSGCTLIVTSHKKLAVPGITHVPLKPLEALDSYNLLRNIAEDIAVGEDEQIANLCGHLPLALRAAASCLSVIDDLKPAEYISQLRDEQARLKALDREADIPEIGVEATFNISYKRLSEEAKRIFRHLSIFPTTFDRKAQESICLDESAKHLSDLVRLSLVFFEERTSRYYLHDLVRIYTDQRLLPDERHSGRKRYASHYLEVARKIAELYEDEATARAGLELFDMEWINLRAGKTWTAEQSAGNTEVAVDCIHYADALKHLLYLRRHPKEQITWLTSALAASRQLHQPVTEGRYHCHLGTAYSLIEPQRAIEDYEKAIEIASDNMDPVGLGNALGGLGNTYAILGRDKLAIEYYRQCLLQLYELNDECGFGRTLTNVGNIHANRGESCDAVEFYKQALELAKEIDDRRGAVTALCNLGDEKALFGKHNDAARYYREALSLMNDTDELQPAALTGLGNAYLALAEHTQAFDCYRKALEISRELGNSRGEAVALGGLGNGNAGLDQFDEALKCHEQALFISQQSEDRRSEVQALTNIGHVNYLKGDTQTALTFHFKALTISREIHARPYEGLALWNIAQNYDRNNEKAAADRYAADAFQILDQLGHPMAEAVRKFIARTKSN